MNNKCLFKSIFFIFKMCENCEKKKYCFILSNILVNKTQEEKKKALSKSAFNTLKYERCRKIKIEFTN